MTPAARIQMTIELLDDILSGWQEAKRIPADKVIDRFFKARRFIGSKDRAYVGELVYWILRHLASARWEVMAGADKYASHNPTNNARLLTFTALQMRKEYKLSELAALCDGSKYAPHTITPNETKIILAKPEGEPPAHVRLNYPEWLEEELKKSLPDFEAEMIALNDQAHTDLRVNTLKTDRETLLAELKKQEFEVMPTKRSPLGIRLKKRAPIFTSPNFRAGHFEVQDEGSQIVAQLVDAKAGMKVIDFCAGAGGKTLAIAAAMNNKGRVLAWDISEKRLKQIKERLKRAGVDNVQVHVLESENDTFIKRHKNSADRVLVDAPCSGTGTWRRNPDLKWRFVARDLQEVLSLQQSILESAARLVAPGGRLIYATCSLLDSENKTQAENFLKNNPHFRVVEVEKIWNKGDEKNAAKEIKKHSSPQDLGFYYVTPHQDGVDGFFAAVFERMAADPGKTYERE